MAKSVLEVVHEGAKDLHETGLMNDALCASSMRSVCRR